MLTAAQTEEIISRYAESARKVAESMNISSCQVYNVWHAARRAGVITESKAPRPLSAVEKQRIIMYHRRRKTVAEIAEMLERPVGTIGCAIQRLQEQGVLERRYGV